MGRLVILPPGNHTGCQVRAIIYNGPLRGIQASCCLRHMPVLGCCLQKAHGFLLILNNAGTFSQCLFQYLITVLAISKIKFLLRQQEIRSCLVVSLLPYYFKLIINILHHRAAALGICQLEVIAAPC